MSRRCVPFIIFVIVVTCVPVTRACAHCEIPCGIYDDSTRIEMLAEHITTIEKSMAMITELSQAKDINYNQLVRWITNKESHADEFQDIVTQYFMTQRIKVTEKEDREHYDNYVRQISLLHQMLVFAMKAKQTTDLTTIEKLRSLLQEFKTIYFGKHK